MADGQPIPAEMYYDEQGEIISADGQPCNPCCFQPNCSGRWSGVPVCFCLPRPPLNGLELFGGVQGFTGPVNRGGSGSFGFHEGFNWGIPISPCLTAQWGVAWTQSNFDGNYLTPDTRNQTFVTAGFYRRVDWGFQGGLVVDYQHDGWDCAADMVQLRGELSWLWCGCNEVGVWATHGVNDAENIIVRQPVFDPSGDSVRFVTATVTQDVNNIYAFFFRRRFASGGDGRLFAGFTSEGQGLVGGDAMVPLNPRWSLRTGFIYAAPGGDDSTTDPRFAHESWNVAISLVWTPCARTDCGRNYCRPLFNVADNGSFLTRVTGQ
jgi:hypothetical protein